MDQISSENHGSPPNLPSLHETTAMLDGEVMSTEFSVCSNNSDLANDRKESSPNGRQATKLCRVCGDKALGYNFNVVTCESCKAFFRRNALRSESKGLRCAFADNCTVNVVSRRFCQKCRLRKCFEVGMKKDWIMSEDARIQKRMRIQENRKKKLEHLHSNPSSESSCDEPQPKRPASATLGFVNPRSPFMVEQIRSDSVAPTNSMFLSAGTAVNGSSDTITIPKDVLVKLLTQHTDSMKIEKKPIVCTCTCSCGVHPPNTPLGPPKVPLRTTDTQTDILDPYYPSGLSPDLGLGFGSDDIVSNMLDAAINSEFDAPRCPGSLGIPNSPLTPGSVRDNPALSSKGQRILDELMVANEVMKEPLESFVEEARKEKSAMSLTDVINMTDIAIRRIIKMSKRVAGFKSLCQEDQIALLKGGCTELMILRGVMNYDPERDSWKGPDGHQHLIKCEVLKGIKGNVYEEHKRYLSSFRPTWRSNEPIMLILGAITLFNPTRAHVQHAETVRAEQEIYYSLLKRYLEWQCSPNEAMEAFEELSEKIEDLHRLNDNVVRIFLDVNPKDVEPLLTEIFDLK